MEQPVVPCSLPPPKKKRRPEPEAPPPAPAEEKEKKSGGWKVAGIALGSVLLAALLYFLTRGLTKQRAASRDLASYLLALPPIPT